MQTIQVQQAASVGTFFGFTLDELALRGPILVSLPERGVVVVWEDHEDFALYTRWQDYTGSGDETWPVYAYADTIPARGITISQMTAAAREWLDNWLDEL